MSIVEKALKKLQSEQPVAPLQPVATLREVPPRPRAADRADVRADVRPQPSRILAVNRGALRAAGLLPPETEERQLADQYRQIKRPLIANALGKGGPKVPNGHLIMVASALPAEGKTFLSINLMLSMALEKDIEVLLVDADVAKPHISNLFGLGEERGLLDALQDSSVDVESLVIPTDVDRLSILPAGRRVGDTATELLASERMEQVVADLTAASPRRIILFDSPPLLLTSESHELASAMGQVVLVVRAGATPQNSVLDAIGHLGEGKAIGLVLNQSNMAPIGGYYGARTYGTPPTSA
jgi:receptor protein-tyrosine kinase